MTRERILQAGEEVLLLIPIKGNKLQLAWEGPYKVVSKVNELCSSEGRRRQKSGGTHEYDQALSQKGEFCLIHY